MHTLASQIEMRLDRRNAAGMSVQIMIRYANHQTITRSKKLPTYIWKQEDILQVAHQLFYEHWNEEHIRLLGITVQEIDDLHTIGHQLDLFTYEQEIEKAKLQETIHSLEEKFGKEVFSKQESKKKNNTFSSSFQKDFLEE